MLDRMFESLNKYYFKIKYEEQPSLAMQFLEMFRKQYYFASDKKLKLAILEQFNKDRNGEAVPKLELKVALKCLSDMDLPNAKIVKSGNDFVWQAEDRITYKAPPTVWDLATSTTQPAELPVGLARKDFEDEIIRETVKYYEETAEKWIAQYNAPEYLKLVEK